MLLKEKIIHESVRLFSLKGFFSTSITDILEATGTSKGGFYNHFNSKEDLFYAVMSKSRKIWRDRNLNGLDQIDKPIGKILRLLENYRDRYLRDSENLPGGCIFVNLSVELHGQESPHLARELDRGFVNLKNMINRLLDEAKEGGQLKKDVNIKQVTELTFCGILGAAVLYGMDKSSANLHRTIGALTEYLKSISA